jgi:hypothetical protein
MSDPVTHTTGPRRLDVRDFLSAGPCQQRPGILNTTHGKIMTTCSECPGLMWAGDCARDQLVEALNHDRT